MHWMDDIKVVIFDLDGTLYQDDTFLQRYLQYLLVETIQQEQLDEIVQQAYAVLQGEHAVQLGYFYDRKIKKVFQHEQFKPSACVDWTGDELEGQIMVDSQPMFIGDVWGVAHLFAEKYNVSLETKNTAFEKVRYEMIQPPTAIQRYQPLLKQIRRMDMEKKIFMTNTAGVTGPAFVDYLQIQSLFDCFLFDAKKPFGMTDVVNKLLTEGFDPQEILSIGDNPFNDLAPVQLLGGRTCLITPYTHYGIPDFDEKVTSVEQLSEFLGQFESIRV